MVIMTNDGIPFGVKVLGVALFFMTVCAFFETSEYADAHLTVLAKDVMPNEYGRPVYTITFDTGEDVFVYDRYNSVDIYQRVEVNNTYSCTHESTQNLFGYKVATCYTVAEGGLITKIDGVNVE